MKSVFACTGHACMCLLVACYLSSLAALCLPLTPFLWVLVAAVLFALLLLASYRLRKVRIVLSSSPVPLSGRLFFTGFAVSLFVLAVFLIGYYPGGISADTVTQWHEAKTAEVYNWHPALHTLLIRAAMCIRPSVTFALVLQMLCYASAVGYTCAVCHRWHIPRIFTVLIGLYLSFSPALGNMMTFLWKDCAFAISVLLLSTQVFEICLSGGIWLQKRRHLLAFGITLAFASILRHNGLALTLPCIVWLLISHPAQFKRFGTAALCFLLAFTGIRGPLYRAADVILEPTNPVELIGLPMVVLSHIYVHAPDALDEETLSLMDSFGPYETFALSHSTGDWNTTKWEVATPKLDSSQVLPIFRMALRSALIEPRLALDALAGLFDMPLLPFGDAYWRMSPYVTPDNWFGFSVSGYAFIARILNGICRLSAHPVFSWLFWRPGMWIIAVMVFCALFGRHRPLSALTLPAMLICYTLVTCVMLSSPTDFRFFLCVPMCAPLALLSLLVVSSPSITRRPSPLLESESEKSNRNVHA